MKWMTWVLFVGLLWICQGQRYPCKSNGSPCRPRKCLTNERGRFLVPDTFNGFIGAKNHWDLRSGCIVFLKKNATRQQHLDKWWPELEKKGDDYLLKISKAHKNHNFRLCILDGRKCNQTLSHFPDLRNISDNDQGQCKVRCVETDICQTAYYNENYCSRNVSQVQDRFIINITATSETCLNCDNPVKKPEEDFGASDLNITSDFEEGEEVNPAEAAEVMTKMADLVSSMNGSSAAISLGKGVDGILVRETEPEDVDEVSFAYVSPNASINIVEDRDSLVAFSRSVTVPKEAFEKSISMNISVPFASVFRFINMAKDEMNSTVLGNEVLAIEMGTVISNLTDTININFRDMKYEGTPSCKSWNGEGSRPNWTDDGCVTIQTGDNITCRCSHLTFFAILLAPPNETLSSSDLNTLTTLTQVGCGLSMFFLSIVIFMHFLMRRTKASTATKILIHLVTAMFLLNFSFLINNFVANLKNSMGCKIMAATMHYFMLATFTWFAAQAFHLCLQLYVGGKIVIRNYILKVSLTSWVLPSVVGVVLLIIGKYGEQVIHTDDTQESVAICWITDSDVHYVVNIGYYALVFLFTFTTFIVILSWLFCLKKTRAGNVNIDRGGKSIVTVLGLCCMLGVTWGFAFFAHGVLRIPAYYIFTVLNSFQGFFLFIYYYNTSHSGEINGGGNGQTNLNSSSISTLKTQLDSTSNPYIQK